MTTIKTWQERAPAPCTFGEAQYAMQAEIDELRAEIERLNKWADGFSDAQLKERATGEAYQAELRAALAEAKQPLKVKAPAEQIPALIEQLRKECYEKGYADGMTEARQPIII